MEKLRLEFASRITLFAIIGIVVLICTVLIASVYYSANELVRTSFKQALSTSLTRAVIQHESRLIQPIEQLYGSVLTPAVQSALSMSDEQAKLEVMQQELMSLVYRNELYYQARWIDVDGEERIRIARRNGVVTAVESAQNKSERAYHIDSLALPAYGVRVSKADLNIEYGELERPLRPTIRYSIRLPTINRRDNGYLIVNQTFDVLSKLSFQNQDEDIQQFIVDDQGNWLVNSDASLEWGHLLGHGDSIKTTDTAVWQLMKNSDQGAFESDSGMWRWKQINLNSDVELDYFISEAGRQYFIAFVPRDVINKAQTSAHTTARFQSVAIALFGLLIVVTALYLIRRIDRSYQIERALRRDSQNQALLVTAISNAVPSAIGYYNCDGSCLHTNHTAERWLGKHQSFQNDVVAKLSPQLSEAFQEALQGNGFSDYFPLSNFDGNLYVNVLLIPDFHDQIVNGVVLVLTDVTELHSSVEAVNDLNVQLEQRTNKAESEVLAKRTFLANMSHEIRTPMNAIIGLVEVLLTTSLDKIQRGYLRNIHTASDNLLATLNDILDLSKLEAGSFSLHMGTMNTESVIKRVVALFYGAAQDKGLQLLAWVDPQLAQAHKSDANRLIQVLNNLVGNAVKFTHQGYIVVRVECLDTSEGQQRLRFSVKDTGIGISTSQKAGIFGEFVQADESITREFGGSGLGLTISNRLTRLLGGSSIQVTSTEGFGSEFSFDIWLDRLSEETYMKPLDRVVAISLAGEDRMLSDVVADYCRVWGVPFTHLSKGKGLAEQNIDVLVATRAFVAGHQQEVEQWQSASAERKLVLLREYREPQSLIDQVPASLAIKVLEKPFVSSELYNAIFEDMEIESLLVTSGTKRPSYNGARVLVVDDSRMNLDVAEALLSQFEVTPDLASSGIQALDMLARKDYDLVLLDLHMPGMDGIETVKSIRDQSKFSHLPVLALSAAVLPEDVSRAIEAGMDAHLAKPLRLDQLATVLSDYLTKKPVKLVDVPNTEQPSESYTRFLQLSQNPQQVLENNGNDRALIARMLDSFGEQYQALDLAKITDLKALKLAVHGLKGHSWFFCFNSLAIAAELVEKDIDQANPVDVKPLQNALNEVLSAFDFSENNKQDPLDELELGASDLDQLLALRRRLEQSIVPNDEQLSWLNNLKSQSVTLEKIAKLIDLFEYDEAIKVIDRMMNDEVPNV